MKQKLAYLVLSAMVFFTLTGMRAERKTVLDERISISVHAAETLESIIFRIQAQTYKPIGFTTHLLMPYKAKAADYKEVSVREILSQQLAGTPILYHFKRKQLVLYLDPAAASKVCLVPVR